MPLNLPSSRYSLPGVTIREGDHQYRVTSPCLVLDHWRVAPDAFEMEVEGVAHFFARKGEELFIAPAPGGSPDQINLYLYGNVLAALLHQRRIINFHASSLIWKEQGLLLLGETGAGKSSLAASFILRGARFLSDDFTPILFENGKPLLWPVYKTIKLREDTIRQLKIDRRKVRCKDPLSGKYFYPAPPAEIPTWPLHTVICLETGEVSQPEITRSGAMQAFSLLRSQICSWEMLRGMPETEKEYLHQLINIIEGAIIIRVVRPRDIPITELHDHIETFLKC